MYSYNKDMTEKKNEFITRAETIVNTAKTEQRELTEAEVNELNEIKANVANITRSIELSDEVGAMERAKPAEKIEERSVEDVERAQFDAYLRNEMRTRAGDPVNMTAGANGAIIPTTIAREIIRRVYDLAPVLERSQRFNVKGKLEIPAYDETDGAVTVAYADEFVDLQSNVGKFTTIELTGHLAGALSKISLSLINNAEFDLVGFIVDEMAMKIARFLEGEILNPSDAAHKVTGLSTLTNLKTAASASAITADELIETQGLVKDVFQRDAIWVMSPSTRDALRELKDDVGRYMLIDDLTAPFGKSLLGKPVYVSDNMADIATGETVIYYGDFKGVATKFTEDMNIRVLRELYAAQHAVGVVGWLEFDAKVIDNQKLAGLTMA